MLAQLPCGIRRYPVLTSSQAVARSEAVEGLESLGTEVSANEASFMLSSSSWLETP